MTVSNNKKASIFYLFSALFNKGIAFLTVPIFTRILSTSDYGIVTTYSSWVDILTVVLTLALYMAIRTSFIDFEKEKKSFLNTVITFTCIMGLVSLIVVIIIANKLKSYNSILLVIAVLQGLSSAIIMDYTQYLMMKFNYVSRTLYMVLPNFLAVIFSIIAIAFIKNSKAYMGKIIPTALIYILFCIIILINVYRNDKPKINLTYLKYGLSISLPLVLHGISLNILSQSDRTMITYLADSSQTGIYSLVYNLGMVATVITTALEGIWIPWFMNNLKEEKVNQINKKVIDYVKLMTHSMIILILVGPEILKLMANKSYWEGMIIIPPIVLSNYIIFIYTLYVNIEHYYKKTISITINTFAAAVCNIIMNFMLIPKFGYIGAAYATLMSYVISLLLNARSSQKLERNLYPLKMFIVPILYLVITTGLFYLLIDSVLYRWGIIFIYVSVILFKEKDTISIYFPILGGLLIHKKEYKNEEKN